MNALLFGLDNPPINTRIIMPLDAGANECFKNNRYSYSILVEKHYYTFNGLFKDIDFGLHFFINDVQPYLFAGCKSYTIDGKFSLTITVVDDELEFLYEVNKAILKRRLGVI